MNKRSIAVCEVNALKNQRLLLLFNNGRSKVFDAAPYLSKHNMPDLNNDTYFAQASASEEVGVVWPNGEYIPSDDLYDYGIRVS